MKLYRHEIGWCQLLFLVVMMFAFSSCSNVDYLNAVPRESTALISMDFSKTKGVENTSVLKTLLNINDINQCGIDISHKVILFESPEGNLGLCASIKDDGDLKDCLTRLTKKGFCTPLSKRRGCSFTVIKNSWIAGFSDNALLIMGPVTVAEQSDMMSKMVKYLNQDEDQGITASKMYESLDSIDSPMAMVAQVQALPDKIIAPFIIGAPKNADATQVIIAAELKVKNGVLNMHGKTFSYNRDINQELQNASKIYRPIKGTYLSAMSSSSLMGIFMNVDGQKFLPLLQKNISLQALLAGINAAIDINSIIKSVDGDMSIVVPSFGDDNLQMSMAAQLANTNWIADVSYWKQSCPPGGKIMDLGHNSYYYTNGKTSFCFGVTKDKQFFSGSSKSAAMSSIIASKNTIPVALQDKIKGQKMVMVVNLAGISGKFKAISYFMKPLFGDVHTLIYTMKQ